MKQLKLILFLAIVLFAACEKEKVEPQEQKNLFELEVNYELSKGNVTIEPQMDKYPEGTKVKLTAQALEGKVFKYWKFNSDNIYEKELTITMESNVSLEAVFEDSEGPSDNEDPDSDDSSNNDSKVDFKLDVKWISENSWEVKADLKGSLSKEISNATIKVGGVNLVEDDFFKGSYKGTIKDLDFGQQFSVSLQHADIAELTYTATTPVSFTKSPSLTGSKENDIINMEWESIECSGYYFYKELENNYGATAVINVKSDSPIKETSYSISVDDIYNGNVSISPAPCYFTLWICPVNRYEKLNGVSSDSYIDVIGRKTNSLTNKKTE